MADKFEWRTPTQIISAADSLKNVSEMLNKLGLEMQKIGMPKMPLPWNQKHWGLIDDIVIFAGKIEQAFPNQLKAHTQDRPSKQMIQLEKSANDRLRREEKKKASPPEVGKKKAGRPRKSSAT